MVQVRLGFRVNLNTLWTWIPTHRQAHIACLLPTERGESRRTQINTSFWEPEECNDM